MTVLALGEVRLTLDPGARLRLDPSGPVDQAGRTVPAVDVLSGLVPPDRFAGQVVLIGSSLPQRGGLRPTAAGPLTPSVQIQADLVAALLTGQAVHRPPWAPWAEALAVLTFGLAAAATLLPRLPPAGPVAVVAALAILWTGSALGLAVAARLLIDPALPLLAAVALILLALIARAVALARSERSLRARIGQLLPPAIVSRLAEEPGLLRLAGQRREVTALFSDIEGFSETARALGPEHLVQLLDAYFALVCDAVLRHGGMVDKIVGDSVHALFNAPLDQAGHVDAAIACAAEIVTLTETFRAEAGIGRTRIGIESGLAVLGDVGAGGRIDYTAHGDAVNLAARLQEINKITGTQVCIGPGAAGLARTRLRPLGPVPVRSFGEPPLFTLPE
jgi:adenylate cyclase